VIEDPAHVAALVAEKAKASASRGMNRLFSAVPVAQVFIERLAERGGNIGGAVARLGELLDAFGVAELAPAIEEALSADAVHVAAVRQALDRHRAECHQPPPTPVALPDDPRVREVSVRAPSLAAYDRLKGGHRG
jgi:hypothetical protein